MKDEKYVGFDKAVNDALVAARGGQVNTNESRIQALERKLETSKLSNAEILDIRRQLKQLKGS